MEAIAADIFRYGKEKKYEEIRTLLQKTDNALIYSHIDKLLGLQKCINFIHYILQAYSIDDEWAHVRKMKFVIYVLKRIQQKPAGDYTFYEQIINRIEHHIQMGAFLPGHMMKICSLMLDGMKKCDPNDKSWIILIPSILHSILTHETIDYLDEQISSSVYNEEVIQKMLDMEWPDKIIIAITSMLLKAPIPPSKAKSIMIKLTNSIDSLDPDVIPLLVYHLLQLNIADGSVILFMKLQNYYGSKLYENKTFCSESIDECTDRDLQKIIESESNTLYHLNSPFDSMVQNYIQFLANSVKLPEIILHPFNMTLLVMTSNRTNMSSNLEIIKTAVIRYYLEEDKRRASCFFRENVPEREDLSDMMQKLVDINGVHREYILIGIIRLQFLLLSQTPQLIKISIIESMWKFARNNLITIIEKKSHTIVDILKCIHNSLKTRDSHFQIIDCLASIGQKFKYATIQNINNIIDVFNDLDVISNYEANVFLEVVVKLVRLSPIIKERVIGLLEKSFFSSPLETRLNVIVAYIKLLKYLKISHTNSLSCLSQNSHSSQMSMSTQMAMSRSFNGRKCDFSNDAICLEVLNNLNRCINQQVEDKINVYEGLPEVITCNKELSISIMDYLWKNFASSFELNEEVLPPIMFKNICKTTESEVVLTEPVGKLMMAIALVLTRIKEDQKDVETPGVEFYESSIQTLAEKMTQSDLEHFITNPDADLTDNSLESQEQLIMLNEAIATYEGFITYFTLTWTNTSEQRADQIKGLFKGYMRLVDHLKHYQRSKKAASKKNTTGSSSQLGQTTKSSISGVSKSRKLKPPECTLPIECLHRFVELLYCESVPWSLAEEANILKPNVQLHRYILQAVISLCENVKQSKNLHHEKILALYKDFENIATNLFTKCIKEHKNLIEFDVTSFILALEAFYEIKILRQHCRSKISDWDDSVNLPDGNLEEYLNVFQELFEDLNLEDDPDSTRLTSGLVNIIVFYAKEIPVNNMPLGNKVVDWLKKMCRQKSVTDKTIASNIVSCLLTVSMRFSSNVMVYKLIAIALGSVLGWITQEEGSNNGEEMSIVNESTASLIHQTVSNGMKFYLDDINWIITRIKIEYTFYNQLQSRNVQTLFARLKARERNVCSKLSELSLILQRMNNLLMEPGTQTDLLMKINISLFTTLTTLGKHFLDISSPTCLAFQQAHFDGLVRHVVKKLLPVIYDQHKFIEGNQQKIPQGKKYSDANALKGKILKETRSIPLVIKGIEQFKKIVMQISKKTKVEVYANLGIGKVREFRVRDLERIVADHDEDDDDSVAETPAQIPEVSFSQDTMSVDLPPKRRRRR